jgi:hypothetical protein
VPATAVLSPLLFRTDSTSVRSPSWANGIVSWVKAPYAHELDALPAVYNAALDADIASLRRALCKLRRGPAVFIGAGGTMVLAQLAARLHETSALQPALPATALQALSLPQLEHRGAVLFSSSAKHPDARLMLADFKHARFDPAIAITHRSAGDIETLAGPETLAVQMPALPQPDGFLATASIMQTAIALIRGYLPLPELPNTLAMPAREEHPLRAEVLVLYPPTLAAVAADIEVRLVESGLATVQLADYRNFAHGRHTGFARRIEQASVIALSERSSLQLAEATLAALDRRAEVRHWHEDSPWPEAVIALIARSMLLVGREGQRSGLDVARPTVPAFGRKLYRLALRKRIPTQHAGPVERKLLALDAGENAHAREIYTSAATAWSEQLRARRLHGLVLDYDGTVCWTARRYELPDEEIRAALTRLLEEGLHIGFASGRGRSLHDDLRRWVPEPLWPQVRLGLYSGAVHSRLDSDLPDLRAPSQWSCATAAALADWPFAELIDIEERGPQVTVRALAPFGHAQLARLVAQQLDHAGVGAQVLASAHSVDIVGRDTRKQSVTAALEAAAGGEALAIGDQGQIGGNDHGLLAHSTTTLTVERCSADPTRCWYAGSGEHTGPAQLLGYLRALKRRRDAFTIGLDLT